MLNLNGYMNNQINKDTITSMEIQTPTSQPF